MKDNLHQCDKKEDPVSHSNEKLSQNHEKLSIYLF